MAGAGLVLAHGGGSKKLRVAAAVAVRPGEFDCGEFAPDGSEWDILGERFKRNPKLDLPEEVSEVVTLWLRCRDPMGGGYRHLPDDGGVNAQGSWIMAAFDIVAAAVEALRPKKGE